MGKITEATVSCWTIYGDYMGLYRVEMRRMGKKMETLL